MASRFIYLERASLNTHMSCTFEMDVHPEGDFSAPPAEIAALNGVASADVSNPLAGAAFTASSTYPGVGSPSVLGDGYVDNRNNSSLLWSSASSDTAPYVEANIGSPEQLTNVEIFNRTDTFGGATDSGRTRDLTLTLYDASHREVLQIAGINAGNQGYGSYIGDGSYAVGPMWLSISFSPTAAQYVRLSRSPDTTTPGISTDDRNTLAITELTASSSSRRGRASRR
jgi:hypothetical protein